jgi:hypothetical protein
MILEHYTSAPLLAVRDTPPAGRGGGSFDDKPAGLWVSVKGERDWPEWTIAESFMTPYDKLCYRIELVEDHNILIISSTAEFDAFEKEFGGPILPMSFLRVINWKRVGEKYKGIIIAPYNYERCMSSPWYYGWDCASGCIWDTSAIKCFYEVPNEHKESECESKLMTA